MGLRTYSNAEKEKYFGALCHECDRVYKVLVEIDKAHRSEPLGLTPILVDTEIDVPASPGGSYIKPAEQKWSGNEKEGQMIDVPSEIVYFMPTPAHTIPSKEIRKASFRQGKMQTHGSDYDPQWGGCITPCFGEVPRDRYYDTLGNLKAVYDTDFFKQPRSKELQKVLELYTMCNILPEATVRVYQSGAYYPDERSEELGFDGFYKKYFIHGDPLTPFLQKLGYISGEPGFGISTVTSFRYKPSIQSPKIDEALPDPTKSTDYLVVAEDAPAHPHYLSDLFRRYLEMFETDTIKLPRRKTGVFDIMGASNDVWEKAVADYVRLINRKTVDYMLPLQETITAVLEKRFADKNIDRSSSSALQQQREAAKLSQNLPPETNQK